MPAIRVVTDGQHERTGRRVGTHRLPIIYTTADWTIDGLKHGMQSGATSLMVLIPASVDGVRCIVAAETSLSCFMMAATTLAGAYRDEIERPGYTKLSPTARDVMKPRLVEALKRSIPAATIDQAAVAAGMILDAFGADAPPGTVA